MFWISGQLHFSLQIPHLDSVNHLIRIKFWTVFLLHLRVFHIRVLIYTRIPEDSYLDYDHDLHSWNACRSFIFNLPLQCLLHLFVSGPFCALTFLLCDDRLFSTLVWEWIKERGMTGVWSNDLIHDLRRKTDALDRSTIVGRRMYFFFLYYFVCLRWQLFAEIKIFGFLPFQQVFGLA